MSRRSPAATARRCAIYTRVSTDHGLEQDFNSLDAQRESCAAYVRSQAQEGWTLAHGRFDDGGYSGASLERPALQALLDAVKQRRIDVIVVYKVDRLTRSLADFAKLVELFDAHGVSFISITQSFNTTTSMGRLTLNMLLSFAQFEREVTGERIRDKIAASKKKGIWVGGVVPLGYKVVDRKLRIDDDEAELVCLIFERYRALGSILGLLQELRDRGVVTRQRSLATGKTIGGIPFTKGPLAYLLKNRMYLGEINHGPCSYPGEHSPIVERGLFEAVRSSLAHNASATGYAQSKSDALLVGKIFDDRGHRMTPSFAAKRGVRYRYYVSRAITEGRASEAGSICRIPAADVERAVVEALARLSQTLDADSWRSVSSVEPGPAPAPSTPASIITIDSRRLIDHVVDRVTIQKDSIDVALTPKASAIAQCASITAPWTKPLTHARRELIPPVDGLRNDPRAMSSDTKSRLLAAIAKARSWLDDLISGRVLDIEEIAAHEKRSARSASMLLSFAFVAPDLVKAIAESRLPRGIGLTRMMDLPSDWAEQRKALGLQQSL